MTKKTPYSCHVRVIVIAVICLAFSLPARAMDPVSTARFDQYNSPATDNNMKKEGDSDVITVAPRFSYWEAPDCIPAVHTAPLDSIEQCSPGKDVYTLSVKKALLLNLPPATAIRISAPGREIAPRDIVLDVSNGSGFFLRQELIQAEENEALVYYPPPHSSERLYRIRHSAGSEADITININTLVTSRILPPLHTRQERLVGFRKAKVKGSNSDVTEMGVTDALQDSSITVQGPAAILLEHRPLYYEDDAHRRAEYRIACHLANLDDNSTKLLRIIEFTNLPEAGQLMALEGTPFTMGRLQRSLLAIPEGRFTLVITPTRPVVARLLEEQAPLYLLNTRKNTVDHTTLQRIYENVFPSAEPAWDIEYPAQTVFAQSDTTASGILQQSRRLANDNHYEPGGLISHRLLQTAIDSTFGRPALTGSADVLAPNTFFRNLLPVDKSNTAFQQAAWFITPRLKNELDRNLVVGSQHIADLFPLLSKGIFLSMPGTAAQKTKQAIRYNIPPRTTDSLLRLVALYPQQETKITLTMDNGTTHHLDLLKGPQLDTDQYHITLPETALALLQKTFPEYSKSTLGGPFSLYEEPGYLIQAAFTDILLPKEVTSVQVRQTGTTSQPLQLALQYRDAKFHTLAETDFLNDLQLAGGREKLFTAFKEWLKDKKQQRGHVAKELGTFSSFNNWINKKSKAIHEHIKTTEGLQIFDRFDDWLRNTSGVNQTNTPHNLDALALLDLENDYFPLVTHLKSLVYSFSSTVAPPPSSPDEKPPLADAKRSAMESAARQAEQQGQWLAALELWGDIKRASSGALQVHPALAQTKALTQLGEHYLAEMMLKGLYLHPVGPGGPELSRMAYGQLEAIYKDNQQEDKLLGLYAVELTRTGNRDLLLPMERLMTENDNLRSALLLAMLHADENKTADPVLYLSLQLGWRKLFTQTLYTLNNKEDFNYYSGLLKIRDGKTLEAETLLQQGGKRGRDLLQSRQRAKEIVSMFSTGNKLEIEKAWQLWQKTSPGPFAWKDTALVKDYAGTAVLLSRTRHLYSQYYRSSSEKEVTVQVHGPTELRFTVRPLHPSRNNTPLTGWIQLKDDQVHLLQSIDNNFPSQTVELTNDNRFSAGQQKVFTYSVGNGDHILKIKGLDMPLLIQVEQKLPLLGCEILPPLSKESFSIVDTPGSGEASLFTGSSSPSCLSQECVSVVSFDQISTETASRIRKEILQTSRTSLPQEDGVPATLRGISEEHPRQSALHCIDDTTGDKEQCLATFARHRHTYSEEEQLRFLGKAAHYYQDRGRPQALSGLLGRPEFRSSWQPVEFITAEEGIRFIFYSGWQPVSPILRTRKALLPELDDNEEILHDLNRVVVATDYANNTTLKIRLRLMEIPYLAQAPLTVAITHKRNGQLSEIAEMTLDSDNAAKHITIPTQEGENQLIFSLKERHTNQFLAIQVQSADGVSGNQLVSEMKTRSYFIATNNNPIVADVHGPALVRIDTIAESGKVFSRYTYIENELERLEVSPPQGSAEGLFRMYYLTARADVQEEVSRLRTPPLFQADFSPLKQQITTVTAPPTSTTITEHVENSNDAIELGVRYDKRRGSEEETTDGKDLFYQSYLTHRARFRNIPAYLSSTALWRVRENGGQVAGLEEEFTWLPQTVPATLRLSADLYSQSPMNENDDFTLPDDEYSILLRGSISRKIDLTTKSHHIPSFSIFKRFLSMGDDDAFLPGHVDQDIYTGYKAEHQDGIRLGESYYFRPWLDTIWFAGASLTSNEWPNHHEPDKMNVRFGWQQLVDDLEAEFSYRGSYFFQDEDRSGESYRDAIQLDFSWDLFWNTRRRIRLGGMVRNDFYHEDIAGYFSISFHFNETARYNAFRPGEIDFIDIKKYRRHQDLYKEKQQ